jgi:hypothetical protein
MADINIHVPDCNVGERGKRGRCGPAGPAGPAGVPGAASAILWAPGGGGDATTFAEVMAFVAASDVPLNIYVNGNATIPAGVYEMGGASLIATPTIGGFTITMADGAQLRNLGAVTGQMLLRATSTALTPLVFDAAPPGFPNIFILNFNGVVENVGTVPMIEVAAGGFFILGIEFHGTVLPGTAALVNLNGGPGTVALVGAFGYTELANNWLTGPAGAVLVYQNVTGGIPSPLPTNAGFAGSTFQNSLFGASCTGPATRPFNPLGGSLPVGSMVFDQSLGATGKPIWWDGTQWVDATGVPA